MGEPHVFSKDVNSQEKFTPGGGQTFLLPALLEAQKRDGYISENVAQKIGRELGVPLAELYGVIEFYDLLSVKPTAKMVVRYCTSAVCEIAGSRDELQAVCQKLDVTAGESSINEQYSVNTFPCLGLCDHAPAALVGEYLVGHACADTLNTWVAKDSGSPGYKLAGNQRRLTARVGIVDPKSLDNYIEHNGYAALNRALNLKPEEIIAEIKQSGLVGRGGAAFPVGVKWEGAAKAQGEPKFVVLNADESEVGTFKDRVLLENDPFSVLEGMAIAAYAVGANYGYIYVRGEYRHAQDVLSHALKEAESKGYLGENIRNTNFNFKVELRSGAGAYICGEETALFESIEGKRGFPRIKPPYPTTHGLFGKPTVINNVETLCNVPLILLNGTANYRGLGTEKSPGTKLFCLSGDIQEPGLVEAPFGLSLRELIDQWGGGLITGRKHQAILLGGAAGVFVPPDMLDTPLTFEDLRAADMALGSGAVMVFDDTRDLKQVLASVAHFFAHESCGKCYPCQLGTQRQLEILDRFAHDQMQPGDRERLQDVGWTMSDASLCGLGQTAAMAVLSAMKHWPELFQD